MGSSRQEQIDAARVFASSRYGENSGDSTHAEPHFRATNYFLTRLFCRNELKRKDFQEIPRPPPWAMAMGAPV